MKIVGLTGGIATGKSTVSHFITTMHIPVVDADVIARDIVKPGTPSYHLILEHFGYEILTPESQIDRAALGNIIFNNQEERMALNSITHPRIRVVMLMEVIKAFLRMNAIVVVDTPLLFEAGFYRWTNCTAVVYCPQTMQMERLISRDNISTTLAKAKMDSQMSIEQKKTLAHSVIDNSGSMASTRKQTEDLIKELAPGTFPTLTIWVLLFWPAFLMYLALWAYTKIDILRNVGIFRHRPLPVIKKEEKTE